jgi:hypothetical protein
MAEFDAIGMCDLCLMGCGGNFFGPMSVRGWSIACHLEYWIEKIVPADFFFYSCA